MRKVKAQNSPNVQRLVIRGLEGLDDQQKADVMKEVWTSGLISPAATAEYKGERHEKNKNFEPAVMTSENLSRNISYTVSRERETD